MAAQTFVNPGEVLAQGWARCRPAVGKRPAPNFGVEATPMELIEWAHSQTQLAHFLLQPCVGDDDENSECVRAINALLEPVMLALSLAVSRIPPQRSKGPGKKQRLDACGRAESSVGFDNG